MLTQTVTDTGTEAAARGSGGRARRPWPKRLLPSRGTLVRLVLSVGGGLVLYASFPPRPLWWLAPVGFAMLGLALYRVDINFRESAVVGIVGAGGIGATLDTAFNRYEFDSTAAILLVIIAIVMLMEYFSGFVRRWVQ